MRKISLLPKDLGNPTLQIAEELPRLSARESVTLHPYSPPEVDIEYGIAQYQNQNPVYPIFYLLKRVRHPNMAV